MSRRVLVVDDDPEIREVLQDRLQALGYTVETASDGCAALHSIRLSPPDGLVLDIVMPQMNGLEVLREMRRCYASVPVLIVTATGQKELADQAMNEGAREVLFGPLHLEQFEQAVERWFGRPTAR